MIALLAIAIVVAGCADNSGPPSSDPKEVVLCDWPDANGDQIYPGAKCELACQNAPPISGPRCRIPQLPLPRQTCPYFTDDWGRVGCCFLGPVPYSVNPIQFEECDPQP